LIELVKDSPYASDYVKIWLILARTKKVCIENYIPTLLEFLLGKTSRTDHILNVLDDLVQVIGVENVNKTAIFNSNARICLMKGDFYAQMLILLKTRFQENIQAVSYIQWYHFIMDQSYTEDEQNSYKDQITMLAELKSLVKPILVKIEQFLDTPYLIFSLSPENRSKIVNEVDNVMDLDRDLDVFALIVKRTSQL
jgi:hypothetical protein